DPGGDSPRRLLGRATPAHDPSLFENGSDSACIVFRIEASLFAPALQELARQLRDVAVLAEQERPARKFVQPIVAAHRRVDERRARQAGLSLDEKADGVAHALADQAALKALEHRQDHTVDLERLRLDVHEGITGISEAAWDALLDEQATPFVRWAWLEALEHSGCVSDRNGWRPRHLALWDGDRLVAAAP